MDDVCFVFFEIGFFVEWLELEIIEIILVEDDYCVIVILIVFKEVGVKIVLDDFGIGYFLFGYLNCFFFDSIKIDWLFVREVVDNLSLLVIIEIVVYLGWVLDM